MSSATVAADSTSYRSKEVLLDALSDYGGTLIFVSHDRYFVDRLATKVIEVGGGVAPLYAGGYEDFLYWKQQREAGVQVPLPTPARKSPPHLKEAVHPEATRPPAKRDAPAAAPPAKRPKGAPDKNQAEPSRPPGYDPLAPRLRPSGGAADRQAREREARKAKARIQELERTISSGEQAVKDIERSMAGPGFYDDRETADKAVAERQRHLDEIAKLMQEWESLQALVEANA